MNGGELAVVAYSYDAVGQLSGKTYGTGTHAIHETMEYNIQGWFTEKNSELFDMSLDYYNKWGRIDDVSPSYTGNITSWQWQHKGDPTGNGPQNRYNFTYDDLSQLTNTDQYVNNEKTRQNVERCLSYDRNGNLQTFIRYENGACVSNSSYNYSGNRLVSYCPGTVFEREDVGIGEIIVPKKGIVFPLTVQLHQYDANGNVTKDWERGLDMSYNCLNLLEYTSDNDANVINYCYLVDGTKLTAVNADDCGFAYRGSFTYYRADAGGDRVFESTRFGGGRIVGTVDDETEVRYFVTDHLGSVRVVATDQNNVLERNDYYPFGKRWDSASLPISDNRDRFNGKEDQAFAGLPFSDYGARMYDRERGRWLSQDPKSEDYVSSTQYGFCGNNPIRYIDPSGMAVHKTDSVQVIDIDPITVTTYRNNPLSNAVLLFMWSAAEWGEMWNNATGHVNSTFNNNLVTGMNLWSSIAISWGISKLFRSSGNITKSTKKQIYKNADDLISAAKELKRLKGGVRQGRVIGNIDEIFQSISQGGQRIGKNSFRLPDGTIITKYSSSTTGVPTIHINKQGQLFKIRVETGINIE